MTRPDFVYRFMRHRTDGQGTRHDLAEMLGGYYTPLICPLKKTGEPIVYVNRWRMKAGTAPDARKGGLILAAPGKAKGEKGRNVSSIFEPSPEHPGQGFGDIGPRVDAILTRRDELAGTLTVFVFLGLGLQAETLFLAWTSGPDGGVSEELAPASPILGGEGLPPSPPGSPYNNVHLATDSET
ncbi:MAG: hypothetical protein ABSF43_13320 [Rectinemataceae bacterium]|jgi:hypothetical protein